METALPHCIATEIRWKRWIVSSGSSVMTEMRLPMSLIASIACWFQEPAVSIAVGMKTCVAVRSTYLAVFEFAALLAAEPASAEVVSVSLLFCVCVQETVVQPFLLQWLVVVMDSVQLCLAIHRTQ